MKGCAFAAFLFSPLLVALPNLASAADAWYLGVSAGPTSYGDQFLKYDALTVQQAGTPGFDGTQNGLFMVPGATVSTSTSTGYDLFAGYHLSRYWALEARYLDMGSADRSELLQGVSQCTPQPCSGFLVTAPLQVSAKTTGFMVSVVGAYPFTDSWGAFATAGVLSASTDITTSIASLSSTRRSSRNARAFSAGLQYNATPDWTFRLGLEQLHGVYDSTYYGLSNIDFTYLSVIYSL